MRKKETEQLIDNIPNYYVYGEKNKNDDPDLFHVERIRTTGKLHKWHMKPARSHYYSSSMHT
jgi:hypothetical protein